MATQKNKLGKVIIPSRKIHTVEEETLGKGPKGGGKKEIGEWEWVLLNILSLRKTKIWQNYSTSLELKSREEMGLFEKGNYALTSASFRPNHIFPPLKPASHSPSTAIDTPFRSNLYPSPSVPIMRNQIATKMISVVCRTQWFNKAQNVTQEAKSKPKIHFLAQHPFKSSFFKRLTKSAYACVWMHSHSFGQKPKRVRLPLEGQW